MSLAYNDCFHFPRHVTHVGLRPGNQFFLSKIIHCKNRNLLQWPLNYLYYIRSFNQTLWHRLINVKIMKCWQQTSVEMISLVMQLSGLNHHPTNWVYFTKFMPYFNRVANELVNHLSWKRMYKIEDASIIAHPCFLWDLSCLSF
jgi:hypothetical protein